MNNYHEIQDILSKFRHHLSYWDMTYNNSQQQVFKKLLSNKRPKEYNWLEYPDEERRKWFIDREYDNHIYIYNENEDYASLVIAATKDVLFVIEDEDTDGKEMINEMIKEFRKYDWITVL